MVIVCTVYYSVHRKHSIEKIPISNQNQCFCSLFICAYKHRVLASVLRQDYIISWLVSWQIMPTRDQNSKRVRVKAQGMIYI